MVNSFKTIIFYFGNIPNLKRKTNLLKKKIRTIKTVKDTKAKSNNRGDALEVFRFIQFLVLPVFRLSLSPLLSFPPKIKPTCFLKSCINHPSPTQAEKPVYLCSPRFHPILDFLLIFIFIRQTIHTHENNYKMKGCESSLLNFFTASSDVNEDLRPSLVSFICSFWAVPFIVKF